MTSNSNNNNNSFFTMTNCYYVYLSTTAWMAPIKAAPEFSQPYSWTRPPRFHPRAAPQTFHTRAAPPWTLATAYCARPYKSQLQLARRAPPTQIPPRLSHSINQWTMACRSRTWTPMLTTRTDIIFIMCLGQRHWQRPLTRVRCLSTPTTPIHINTRTLSIVIRISNSYLIK